MKIPIIIYSHSSYSDILKIQTDYIQNLDFNNKILFINNNDENLNEIYASYDKIIFYDDKLPYASRVSECLKVCDFDYFLFSHDIDILLNVNIDFLEKLLDFIVKEQIDRVDLKYTENVFGKEIIELSNGIKLVKEIIEKDYIYNVNPSIWKKETLLEIMTEFKDRNYRTIEDLIVQSFCKKYKIFKINTQTFLKCGYFNCIREYMFLHIRHNGKFLPLNENFVTIYNQSYEDISNEYLKIVGKYNLINSNKWYK
jgi:hypothetical protein